VRIIPVSSVGDFVTLESNWEVRKVAGRTPTHLNVEVPLVAAIVDICDMARTVLRDEEKKARLDREKAKKAARAVTDRSTADVTVGPRGLTVNLSAVMAFTIS